MNLNLVEEGHPSKVSGQFDGGRSAQVAMDALVRLAESARENIRIIQPNDAEALSKRIEPESHGIALTLAKSHLILGVAGFAFGLLVSTMLVLMGPPVTASSPVMTFFGITTISTFAALLIAGLVSILPDHDPLIVKAEENQRKGRWTVVAHTSSSEEMARAREVPYRASASPRHTF